MGNAEEQERGCRGGTDEKRIQFYVFNGRGTGRPPVVEEIERRVQALLPALRSLSGLASPIGK